MFTELRIAAGRRPLTRTEAWATAIIGLVFAGMFLGAVIEEFSLQKLSIFFFILFWFAMLVVHELGHALVAKALGWRVREIVIGFGRTMWRWQVGETQIKVKLAPIEGYVLPAPTTTDRARLKSALIYAAGPGAELAVLGGLLAVFGWSTVFGDHDDLLSVALKSLAFAILLGAGFSLLPFRTEGAATDGLGILSSPFRTDESIQRDVLAFDLQDIDDRTQRGDATAALERIDQLLIDHPNTQPLRRARANALSARGQDEAAREYVHSSLSQDDLSAEERRSWLKLQAQIELNAAKPQNLVLDLALQKALAITPDASDLMAIKGASLVQRGYGELGGNILAAAWRNSVDRDDDALMLAYLTIAAHQCGDASASRYFRDAFNAVNTSVALSRRVDTLP